MVFEVSDKKVRDVGDTEFAFQLSFPRSGGCVSYGPVGKRSSFTHRLLRSPVGALRNDVGDD